MLMQLLMCSLERLAFNKTGNSYVLCRLSDLTFDQGLFCQKTFEKGWMSSETQSCTNNKYSQNSATRPLEP